MSACVAELAGRGHLHPTNDPVLVRRPEYRLTHQRVGVPSKTALVLSVALICGFAFLGLSHQDLRREIGKSLTSFRVAPLAAAFLLVLAQVGCQSLRFWAAVPPGARLTVVEAAHVFTAGDWANIFAPARGGDVLKVVLMKRVGGDRDINLPGATGAVLADKIVDLGSLLLLCAITGSLGIVGKGADAPNLGPLLVGAGTAAVLLALIVVSRRTWSERLKNLSRQLWEGLSTLKHPVRCLISVSFGVGAWAAEMFALLVLCGGLGVAPAPPRIAFALALLNVGTAIPVSVASLGVYEAALTYGLSQSGLPLPSAIAVATAHHVLQLLALSLCAAAFSVPVHVLPRHAQGQPGRS